MPGPLTVTSGRIRLALRVQPGASRDDIGPISLDAEGSSFLKVHVTQPAEGGKANRAVITLLAKTWRLPVTSMVVVAATGVVARYLRSPADLRWRNRFKNGWEP